MATLPRNFRKIFFRMAPVEASRESLDRCVNKFRGGNRLKLHNKCAIFKEGRKGGKYLDISVKSNYLDFRSNILDFTSASKSVIDRKTTLVGYSFFDTPDEFLPTDKNLSITAVDITEDRGPYRPAPEQVGE